MRCLVTETRDRTEGLSLLGRGGSPVPQGEPGPGLLEAFPNRRPERDYIIRISFPEFTSLCPVTGQPDFGTIVLDYVAHERCVESKSFKLYMFAFRNHRSFIETVTNTILDDVCGLAAPCWARVRGLFVPRGGKRIQVFAERLRRDLPPERQTAVRKAVAAWKSQPESAAL